VFFSSDTLQNARGRTEQQTFQQQTGGGGRVDSLACQKEGTIFG
jgi:hypothetical protein